MHQVAHRRIVVDHQTQRRSGKYQRCAWRIFFCGFEGCWADLGNDPCCGEPNGERRTLSEAARDTDLSPHQLAKFLTDGQPQTCAAVFARGRCIGLREGLEEFVDLLRTYADASV